MRIGSTVHLRVSVFCSLCVCASGRGNGTISINFSHLHVLSGGTGTGEGSGWPVFLTRYQPVLYSTNQGTSPVISSGSYLFQ